jgi:hypothetical protein
MPALEPHADQHFRLDYVIGAHVVPGYVGSVDLLTRPAGSSNFATDTCIRREGVDPRTNGRYLEEVSFEVVHEQSTKDITERAEDLTARGVRRVFAIFVKKREVREWSRSEGAWKTLGSDAAIRDACLCRPLPVRELLDAAAADDAAARALVEKDNPVIVEVRRKERAEGRRDGLEEGRRDGQLSTLARQFERRLGRTLADTERATLGEQLDRLGLDRLDDVRLERSAEGLAAWLADPSAR